MNQQMYETLPLNCYYSTGLPDFIPSRYKVYGEKICDPDLGRKKTVDCYKGLMPLRYFAGWLALMVNFG